MKVLVSGSNPVGLWGEIIHEAQATCATVLQKDIEAYLVMMLMRYMDKPDFIKQIAAERLLQALEQRATLRELALQDVGDSCLLFTGLFPGMAEQRMVKISYFVNIGRGAYVAISRASDDVYSHLAHDFVSIMDVLQSIRQYAEDFPDLLPFQAYDLWNETGSKRALNVLRKFTAATPVASPLHSDSNLITIKK